MYSTVLFLRFVFSYFSFFHGGIDVPAFWSDNYEWFNTVNVVLERDYFTFA